jgi:asparagine synthase (glutamine-hydrolysing)
MTGAQGKLFAERIDEAIALSGGIIAPGMRDVLSRVSQGKAAYSYHIWRVVSFGAWLKKFNVEI